LDIWKEDVWLMRTDSLRRGVSVWKEDLGLIRRVRLRLGDGRKI
jgi:hypothetical protein